MIPVLRDKDSAAISSEINVPLKKRLEAVATSRRNGNYGIIYEPDTLERFIFDSLQI